ncbi:plasmid maintenance system antidote protein [Chitinophaga silvatica]|uniref:Plasmid maintenance system antidote protein n=1 Tax=Chitinophaga silvatica TaxID=2282649 RepID=A0A3E1YAB4_9BACT|nr:plasmid maintenance system antidote protein [Chitinophaga silvatica]RFS22576.1 plasmid maintenance system antidote protein [Chitinophaga silvatica]
MQENISILKGIHPGIVLERELKKRKLKKRDFALSISVYPQILSAITKGKRNMNTALALKIEHALNMEEGYFMILQVFHDIKEEKSKQSAGKSLNLPKLRKVLFWDTQIERIDWQKQKRAIIKRVFERGTEKEKQEIIRFYGKPIVDEVLKNEKSSKHTK